MIKLFSSSRYILVFIINFIYKKINDVCSKIITYLLYRTRWLLDKTNEVNSSKQKKWKGKHVKK